jgi:hypothetical protein
MQHKEKKGWFSDWFGSSQIDKKGTTKTTIACTSSPELPREVKNHVVYENIVLVYLSG